MEASSTLEECDSEPTSEKNEKKIGENIRKKNEADDVVGVGDGLTLTVPGIEMNTRATGGEVATEVGTNIMEGTEKVGPAVGVGTLIIIKDINGGGGRREDDWTCPSCGNVNFSFRTTCNMRNCTQPRPANHNYKSGGKAMQTPQGYASATAGHYVGSGAPSSMYIGVQPYGSSLSMPSPYDVHVPSAYHYSYGILLSGGSSPYRPLPPPYIYIFVVGMYGVPPMMDRYLPLGHTPMGLRPGFYPEEKAKKGVENIFDNDWVCPDCGNVNFSFRTVCNMRKCNTPKPGSQASKSGKNSKGDMPDGSWKCDQCNNINYPFRTKFSRQNCGAEKPSESGKSPTKEAEENDQSKKLLAAPFYSSQLSSPFGHFSKVVVEGCCCFSLIDSLQLLIGLFNLDPNRVFDIVLECFKLQPDNNVFLNLIPVFPKLARTCYNFYQSTPTKLAVENYFLHSG
ncbi:ranBP2-type zinc finger protein At1g67325-like [Lactuca sativa]|uniref:ranBP2-type zinc finger protein At1g67325-like n=1 Tax=Lactuca sativa TaxID=4236 RepID=UPI0022AF9655|nr:ranBP2-type zinc finger protein At1g67325-like [Lactuca sativa]